jgi:CheY-like chemotaxis protein/HPt (histidine-containing phosphotransfer) domain-containing protein
MASQQDLGPRILLVEDDPTSRSFFLAVLQSLPAQVDCADSLLKARQQARLRQHDLLLIDVNLPDGTGIELLQQLQAVHPSISALAHTAETDTSIHQALLDAGFLEVVVKPISTERLMQAVRRGLARNQLDRRLADSSTLDWDESTALAALNGQRTHMNALRELFLSELPGTRDAVDSALRSDDEQALRNHLHRLQASCGFVGATRLAGAVRQLRGAPHSVHAHRQFREAVAALLH